MVRGEYQSAMARRISRCQLISKAVVTGQLPEYVSDSGKIGFIGLSSARRERHWKRARGANKVTLLLRRYAVGERNIIHRIQELVSGNFNLKPRQLAADAKVATARKSTVTRVLFELYRRIHSLTENIELLGVFILARVMISRCQK